MKALEVLAKMKTIKNIFEPLLNKEKIKSIIILASKGKKKRKEVIKVLDNIDYYTAKIYEMLENGTYYMSKTHNRSINENGKIRVLTISPFFPNRILDYIMVETLKPYIRKSMYEYCVGNVDGKGIVFGVKAIKRHYKRYKYYIKLDIRHFYPSTSSTILFDFIKTKVKDERFLELCKCVVLSEKDMPIGSYYSQWFSNWFLQDIDHYIKEQLKIPFYVRYVDDMVLMANNKRLLANAMYKIKNILVQKGLILKNSKVCHNIKEPLDFLGYKFCDNMFLRKRCFKRLNKRVKHIRKHKNISLKQAQGLLSYIGWLKQIKQGYQYYINKIRTITKIGTLKRVVSYYSRRKTA